jgi:hypothetical protein
MLFERDCERKIKRDERLAGLALASDPTNSLFG